MSSQCNKQAVDMVRCTGSTRWRKRNPRGNDTVLLLMGRSPDSHINSTARRIPIRVKCLIVVGDAESWVKGLLALVQTCATGLTRQTAGMVIVQDRHQHAMQPLNDGKYRCKPVFRVRTTYIIPRCATQGAIHHLPLTPLAEISRWYLSNTIDFTVFNFFTCRLFNLMLEVIVAEIYRNLMSVYSGCLNFCNASCTSLCIIDVSRDWIEKNSVSNGSG